jgi:hypothetical protein
MGFRLDWINIPRFSIFTNFNTAPDSGSPPGFFFLRLEEIFPSSMGWAPGKEVWGVEEECRVERDDRVVIAAIIPTREQSSTVQADKPPRAPRGTRSTSQLPLPQKHSPQIDGCVPNR